MRFKSTLRKIILKAVELGFEIKNSRTEEGFFKGDLDGKTIWVDFEMNKQDMLFNVLHLVGHCIQWNVSAELRELGDQLHDNPSDEMILRLQKYEWEANCYALQLLHDVGVIDLDLWLYNKYQKDMYYLTHYYKTKEKIKTISPIAVKYAYTKLLEPLAIPSFSVTSSAHTRAGIVI